MKKLFAVLIISMLSTVAHAEKSKYGGMAVVCRDLTTKKITKASMLDLFEGKNLPPKMSYPNTGLDLETRIEVLQTRMIKNAAFLAAFKVQLDALRSNQEPLSDEIGLPAPINDSFPTIKEKGCKIKQVAAFDPEDGKLYVDQEIYNVLSRDVNNSAALFVDVALYEIARAAGDVSAVRTRKLTAHLLGSPAYSDVIETMMLALAPIATPTPTPTQPSRPRAFDKIWEGTYTTETPRICKFKISKDYNTGEMYFTWTGRDCDQAGKYVELSCNYSECKGFSETLGNTSTTCQGQNESGWFQYVVVSPQVPGQVSYELRDYENRDASGSRCYAFKSSFHL